MYILRSCPYAEDILDTPEVAAAYVLRGFSNDDLDEILDKDDETPYCYT